MGEEPGAVIRSGILRFVHYFTTRGMKYGFIFNLFTGRSFYRIMLMLQRYFMLVKSLLLVLTLCMCSYTHTYGQENFLAELRKELFYADFDLEKSEAFYDKIVASQLNTATTVAYRAAAKALIAKYAWNPATKISALRYAERSLKEAVSTDASNLEIRFLRFYIENSIPSYLGYSKNLAEDHGILSQNLHRLKDLSIDGGIAEYISRYISGVHLSP